MNHNFSRFLRSGQNLSLLIERGIIDSNDIQSKYFKITPMLSITFSHVYCYELTYARKHVKLPLSVVAFPACFCDLY